MTVQRLLALAGLVIGLAIAIVLWLVWLDLTLKLRQGPGITSPIALLPPAVIVIEIIAVMVSLVQMVRDPRHGLTASNVIVWSSNLISYVMLLLFGSR